MVPLLHRHHDQSRFPSFELQAGTQSSLSAPDPGVIESHDAVQRLAAGVHHRTPELVDHHPRRFIVSPTPTAAVTGVPRGHACQSSSNTPPRTRLSGESWSGARSSRTSPKFGAGTPHIATAAGSPVRRPAGARSGGTQIHPAICTGPNNTPGKLPPSEAALELPQSFGERRQGHALTLPVRVC